MRWPSIAPPIGATSPPYPIPVPMAQAMIATSPSSAWCSGGKLRSTSPPVCGPRLFTTACISPDGP